MLFRSVPGAETTALFADLVVGGDDTTFVYTEVPLGSTLSEADARITLTGDDLQFGDFDGDGATDLLDDTGVVFGPLPAGTGTALELGGVAIRVEWPHARPRFVVGDLDGDGATDLVSDSEPVNVYFGLPREGGLVTPTSSVPCEHRSTWLDPIGADLDGDGRSNLVLVERTGTTDFVSVWARPPTGEEACGTAYARFAANTSPTQWLAGARFSADHADLLYESEEEYLRTRLRTTLRAPGSDADRDGYTDDDCDDAVVTVHPFAYEESDGLDQDCDGAVDDHVDRAELLVATLPGPSGSTLRRTLWADDDVGGRQPRLRGRSPGGGRLRAGGGGRRPRDRARRDWRRIRGGRRRGDRPHVVSALRR